MGAKKRITAEELMRELEADPDWRAARERGDRERARREEEWSWAEAPLVEELRRLGYVVSTAWDLVNTGKPYADALPVLLAHVARPYPDRVREGIARALAVPPAKFGWPKLLDLYRREPAGTDAKDGLAVALAAIADRELMDDVVALARDRRHGASRILLLGALARSRQPQARAALTELAGDPQLASEVARILKRSLPSTD